MSKHISVREETRFFGPAKSWCI